MRICSPDLKVMKGAKEVAKTLNPSLANPAATPIIFCSAIPEFMYLSGKDVLYLASPEESPRSPEIANILGFVSASDNIA